MDTKTVPEVNRMVWVTSKEVSKSIYNYKEVGLL